MSPRIFGPDRIGAYLFKHENAKIMASSETVYLDTKPAALKRLARQTKMIGRHPITSLQFYQFLNIDDLN